MSGGTDGVELKIDPGQFDRAGRQIVKQFTGAGSLAISSTTKYLERQLEAATQAAVPGKLWKAWASKFYPNDQADAAGIVYVKGKARSRGAITFWTKPGEVRGKRGQYLAIPLPAAGSRGRKRDLTPGEWEQAHGIKLRFVYRRSRASLLVADEAVLSGKAKVARRNTAGRIAAGRASTTVPIFVLLPMLRFRNALAIEPIIAAAERTLATTFVANAR